MYNAALHVLMYTNRIESNVLVLYSPRRSARQLQRAGARSCDWAALLSRRLSTDALQVHTLHVRTVLVLHSSYVIIQYSTLNSFSYFVTC